jgi:hypothetical protein
MITYDLCRDTVTVYRLQEAGVHRQVLEGCLLTWEEQIVKDVYGSRKGTEFLLIHPGKTQEVFPGDRVMQGIGPEITKEEWGAFIPAAVPGLGQVSFVRSYRWGGELQHIEAGSRQPVQPQL